MTIIDEFEIALTNLMLKAESFSNNSNWITNKENDKLTPVSKTFIDDIKNSLNDIELLKTQNEGEFNNFSVLIGSFSLSDLNRFLESIPELKALYKRLLVAAAEKIKRSESEEVNILLTKIVKECRSLINNLIQCTLSGVDKNKSIKIFNERIKVDVNSKYDLGEV